MKSEQWRREGNAFLNDDNLPEAERCYRNGIQAHPADAICYSNLGYVLVQMGRSEEAERTLRDAVERNPSDFDAYYLLGNLARERGDSLRAIACFRTALRNNPDFDFCRRDLCILLAQTGQPREARTIMDQGPAFDTDSADYYLFKGNMHLATGEYDPAVDCFQGARKHAPRDATILINLGAAQIGRREVLAAVETYREVLGFEPDNVTALANMAAAFQLSGQLELAVQSYRQALRVNPQHLYAQQNLLYVLSHMPNCSPSAYLEEAQNYGTKVRAMANPYTQWQCEPLSPLARPLRIGFVSGDLRMHPVGYFLESMLPHVDTARFTWIAYSTAVIEDVLSARLRDSFHQWRQIASVPDADLAQQIHSDQIDVLVDLAGHTANNRLSVFAWRPAPVQVAWLGYWASTGVAEVDYLVVDNLSVRQDEATSYSEQLWRLPDTRLCLTPPTTEALSNVTPLPALHNGYVTFASFQALSKISDATLEVWSKVLAGLPTSRLRLQSIPLSYPESLADMQRRLELAHIELHRVDLVGGTSREGYLAAYGEVDVILDTFPFPGGTTTAEALWMGVPTVSLAGNTLLSRQGESMLRCAGLPDWVAGSTQEYVQLAISKVEDLHHLALLRASLRVSVLESPLFDGARFAKNFETALEGMVKAAWNRAN
ncbi:MAG: tetratricopeptide repeat protein [Candidatus Saccharibacteria bacterium]|nr:tetratricopeptide repeat protein [Rhodoferax sp.]